MLQDMADAETPDATPADGPTLPAEAIEAKVTVATYWVFWVKNWRAGIEHHSSENQPIKPLKMVDMDYF